MAELFITTPLMLNLSSNEIVAINAPARAQIIRAQVVELNAQNFTSSFYNRSFSSGPYALIRQTQFGGTLPDDFSVSASDHVVLEGSVNLPFAVGDRVVVASSDISGYNVNHRVIEVLSPTKILTDQTYTALGAGGTASLSMTTIEKNLYKILDITGTSGIGTFTTSVQAAAVNADPLPKGMSSRTTTPIYALVSAAGDYRFSITFAIA